MKATIVCTALLMLFQLVPASAGDNPVYMSQAGDPGKPYDPGDAVLPVEPPDGKETAKVPNLRPPGFRTYMYDTAIWYGVQWAGRLWWVRDKNRSEERRVGKECRL